MSVRRTENGADELEDGHDARERRGRSAIRATDPADTERQAVESRGQRMRGGARSEVARAMQRLLELGGVEAASRYVVVDDEELHYLEAGSGPDLVLLQGAGGGCANWYRLLGPLSNRFRVLSPDLPGFGLSAPIEPRPPLGVHGAGIIRQWLESVGGRRCHVMATSFGGLIALRLAQYAPGLMRRLVLLDVVGLGRELPLGVRLATLPLLGRRLLRPNRAGAARLFRKLLTTDRSELGPAHEDALIEYIWRSDQAGPPGGLARALRLFGGLRGQREVLTDAELAGIRVPVLLLWGERDGFLPLEHARRAERLLPDATLRVIRDAGHSPNWERPQTVLDAVIPFLEAAEP